jgi:hypothetical protein
MTTGYDDWNGPYLRVTVRFSNDSARQVTVNRYRVTWPDIVRSAPDVPVVGTEVTDVHFRIEPGAVESRTARIPYGGFDPSLLAKEGARVEVLDWQ